MARITAAREMPLEGMPDAPDEEWLRAWLEQQNGLGRQVVGGLQRGLTVADNTTSLVKELDLVHGQSVTVANPLSVPLQGIFAIGCTGLSVGSDGRPNGGVYDLTIPDIQAKPSTKGDGSWVVQANYAIGPNETTGYAGEQIRSILPFSSRILLTTTVAANLTSITLTPGTWDISAMVGHNSSNGGAVTGERFLGAISTVSATMPAADSVCDSRGDTPQPPAPTTASVIAIPQYRVTPATSTIYYLVAQAVFSTSNDQAWGRISAVRSVPYLAGRTGRVKLFFFGG